MELDQGCDSAEIKKIFRKDLILSHTVTKKADIIIMDLEKNEAQSSITVTDFFIDTAFL